MTDYRRWYVAGGTYFFTLVTHGRRHFLTDDLGRRCLRVALRHARHKAAFRLIAIVVLPDHLHMVWELPPGDDRFSYRISQFKEKFIRQFLAGGGVEGTRSASRGKRRERAVWQRRFWEHVCQDEFDLQQKVDYIHWNPVKHGYVQHVRDYRWSSFFRYVRLGQYPLDWGNAAEVQHILNEEWE